MLVAWNSWATHLLLLSVRLEAMVTGLQPGTHCNFSGSKYVQNIPILYFLG